MVERRRNPARFIVPLIFGVAVIFPILNQSGILTMYEAIAGIWLLFLVPVFFFYRSVSRRGDRKVTLRFSIAVYLIAASFYSLLEPVIAGYNLGSYIYLIVIPASLLVMVPSFYVAYRSRYVPPKQTPEIDQSYTSRLRSLLSGIDDNPPEVFMLQSPRRIGGSFVTHTDGRDSKIGIYPDAKEVFDEREMDAILVRGYCEWKEKSALKLIYSLNIFIMVYLDAIIFLSAGFRSIQNAVISVVILFSLVVLIFGFMLGFPLLVGRINLRREMYSDRRTAEILKDTEVVKSCINKSIDNYLVSPMATPSRASRIMKNQRNMAAKRISALS